MWKPHQIWNDSLLHHTLASDSRIDQVDYSPCLVSTRLPQTSASHFLGFSRAISSTVSDLWRRHHRVTVKHIHVLLNYMWSCNIIEIYTYAKSIKSIVFLHYVYIYIYAHLHKNTPIWSYLSIIYIYIYIYHMNTNHFMIFKEPTVHLPSTPPDGSIVHVLVIGWATATDLADGWIILL